MIGQARASGRLPLQPARGTPWQTVFRSAAAEIGRAMSAELAQLGAEYASKVAAVRQQGRGGDIAARLDALEAERRAREWLIKLRAAAARVAARVAGPSLPAAGVHRNRSLMSAVCKS